MRTLLSLLLAVVIVAGLAPQVATAQGQGTIDFNWVTYRGTTAYDSTKKAMDLGGVDTTDWVKIPDSSAQGGGVYVVVYSDEDTTKTGAVAGWGYFDAQYDKVMPLPATTVLDTMVANINSVTSRNPMGATLHFRKPRGAQYVRLICTANATIGQWQPDYLGLKHVPWIDALLVYPRF